MSNYQDRTNKSLFKMMEESKIKLPNDCRNQKNKLLLFPVLIVSCPSMTRGRKMAKYLATASGFPFYCTHNLRDEEARSISQVKG